LAYLIPAGVLSFFAGPLSLYWTIYWWGLTWLAVYFIAGAGIEASVRCSSSWRALLAMMASAGKAFFSRFVLLGLSFGTICTGLIFLVGPRNLSDDFIVTVFLTLTSGPLAVLFFAQGEMLLTEAEKLLAKAERGRQ
jgi:hypothetical protein